MLYCFSFLVDYNSCFSFIILLHDFCVGLSIVKESLDDIYIRIQTHIPWNLLMFEF